MYSHTHHQTGKVELHPPSDGRSNYTILVRIAILLNHYAVTSDEQPRPLIHHSNMTTLGLIYSNTVYIYEKVNVSCMHTYEKLITSVWKCQYFSWMKNLDCIYHIFFLAINIVMTTPRGGLDLIYSNTAVSLIEQSNVYTYVFKD